MAVQKHLEEICCSAVFIHGGGEAELRESKVTQQNEEQLFRKWAFSHGLEAQGERICCFNAIE